MIHSHHHQSITHHKHNNSHKKNQNREQTYDHQHHQSPINQPSQPQPQQQPQKESAAPIKAPFKKDNERTYNESSPIKRSRYHQYVLIAVAAVIAIIVLAHSFVQFNPTNSNTTFNLTKQTPPGTSQVRMGQPFAYGQYLTTKEDTSKTFTLKGNETGQIPIRFSINNNPVHGTLPSFDPKTGKITYTPKPGFVGSDSFGFLVTDSHNMTSNIGKVSINVGSFPTTTTPSEPPVYYQNFTTTENSPITITLKGSVSGQIPITFLIYNSPQDGNLTTLNSKTGKVTYIPNAGFIGNDSFGFEVMDNYNKTRDIGVVSISVSNQSSTSSASVSSLLGNSTTTTPPLTSPIIYKQQVILYDKEKNCASDQHTPTTYMTYLTHFSCGHVTQYNGTTIRRFTLIIDDYHGFGKNIPITKEGLQFPAWTFNGTIPGPTLRMTEGDHVIVDVINSKDSNYTHNWHVDSIHSGAVDGVMGNSGMIFPGQSFEYKFVAQPYGIYPYYAYIEPFETHINRGLYGTMIIDPPFNDRRTPATEFVMLMNGYSYGDLNNTIGGGGWVVAQPPPTPQQMANATERAQILSEKEPGNDVYSVNGMAFGYTGKEEIHLKVGQQVRIYLVNMLEFDALNTFELQGDMFYYIPTGTNERPSMYTNSTSLMQGDRGILEFAYHNPGQFMLHARKVEVTRLGWLGYFNVTRN